MLPRSLRLKLAAWFVLVFFVIQAVLIAGVAYFRRDVIQKSLDDRLTVAAEDMVDNILNAGLEWEDPAIHEWVPRRAGFVLYTVRDRDGNVLVSHGLLTPGELAFGPLEAIPSGPLSGVHRRVGAERANELTGVAEELRLVTLPFRRQDELYYFQAAVHDRLLDALLGPFFDLVLVGVPVGVVAAMAAAWIIAGRAVAPMRRLSRAARDVSPTSLSERFETRSTDEEVERLEEELNSALERLEAGYRAQEQFISNVSHELRTPVAALLAHAQVAKMGKRDLEKSYAFVDRSEMLLKRLGKLVESFLVLARADIREKLPRERVPVADVVLGCLHGCKEAADQDHVRLVSHLAEDEDGNAHELVLVGDGELLQTMLENLVRNAIGHSPTGGEVAIEAAREADSVRLAVRDHGPGIPAEYRTRVFDRFVQVPRNGTSRGTGLGLAIASGIARLHGGGIVVEGEEGEGCTFVVRLPVAGPEADDDA